MTDLSPKPQRDVRMRGFTHRTSVEVCRRWIDVHTAALEAETVAVNEAAGRVLAEEILSDVDVPGFDRSAMDGYALRGEETVGAGDYSPLSFRLIGESLPGAAYAGSVGPGEAVRIMTGAPLPEGADAVLPAEFAEEAGGAVHATEAAPPGKNVGRRGEDIAAGSRILSKGRRLRPQDLGVLASIGRGRVEVVRPPRVRLVVTGDELLPAGSRPTGYRIADSNSWMLEALIRRDGGVPLTAPIVPDQPEALRAALVEGGVDMVLVSGGSSVGTEDHAPRLLAEVGELAIHGVAMRPSSPAGMGRIDGALVFLLPGNPVSCLCAYDFFAGRAIRRLGGRSGEFPHAMVRARLRRKIASAVGRVDYTRVRVVGEEVEPLAISGASILSSTTRADGFTIVPADSEGFPAGAEVTVLLYET
jgi:molybdopterin molybdotransferase